MNLQKLLTVVSIILISILIFSCSENAPQEPQLDDDIIQQSLGKIGDSIVVNALPYGYKNGIEYVFDHYSAKPGIEFGIWPSLSQMYDSAVMQELNSYWGFNYVAIIIGNPTTVTNAQNYFGLNHTMALVTANDAGRSVVEFNTSNGLPASTAFWSYYTDEPATIQCLSSYGLDLFENFVHEKRPSSLFGFGDVTRQEIGNYITNTITNSLGQTVPNPYPVNPDYVMCTKYDGENIPRWDLIRNLTPKFTRTWINNSIDVGEFNTVLNNLKNNGISPWLYVETVDAQNRVQYMWDYCNAAFQQGYLNRYYKKYQVMYRCNLNHTHDPEAPYECYWVEYTRTLLGIVQL